MLTIPALTATHAGVWIATPDGPAISVGRGDAIRRAADTPHVLLNAPVIASRLGYPELGGLDLLDHGHDALEAGALPAQFLGPGGVVPDGRVLEDSADFG